MPNIQVLDQQTIDKIAAGEVVERPSSVVKELVENAIDAQASAVTVEIKEGGISFIRITDNGCGIEKEQVPLAFLRHSTSKIKSVEDLFTVSSLGFRGEALSSIAAVSQVELITKTPKEMSGVRYVIEGGKEQSSEEIGAPEGTTFLVRNLFYNTPARRKFLKAPQTEAGYIGSLMEKLALSHPEISFKFIANNQLKLHTSGNSNLKEIIYHIHGKEIAGNLLEVHGENELFSVSGFIGKPLISRGNRNYENYFINGRYIKSALIAKSIEEGYKSFVMQHKYPYTVLHISVKGELLDVNVHPTKMELRFSNGEAVYQFLTDLVKQTINQSELVYQASLEDERAAKKKQELQKKEYLKSGRNAPEPFETKRLQAVKEEIRKDSPYEKKYEKYPQGTKIQQPSTEFTAGTDARQPATAFTAGTDVRQPATAFTAETDARQPAAAFTEITFPHQSEKANITGKQPDLAAETADYGISPEKMGEQPNTAYHVSESAGQSETAQKEVADDRQSSDCRQEEFPQVTRRLLDISSQQEHQIIGQLFDTYWLVEFDSQLYIIDQHAAHEKVLYERTMKSMDDKEYTSQAIYPPILVTLNMQEEELLKKYMEYFEKLGFVLEHFGGREYSVTSVPANLFGIKGKELLVEMLDSLSQFHGRETPQIITEKIASMSCKAAVKGNQKLSRQEVEALIAELLTLENPYHCPHGRPTIISMTKYELEKKFKRVL